MTLTRVQYNIVSPVVAIYIYIYDKYAFYRLNKFRSHYRYILRKFW